jgi:hypothetical protein
MAGDEFEWFKAEAKRQHITLIESVSRTGKTTFAIANYGETFFKLIRMRKRLSGEEEVARFEALCMSKLLHWRESPLASRVETNHRAIDLPDQQEHVRRMLDNAKSFLHEGVRYFPLSAAASIIQAPRSTLLDWIKKGTEFGGKSLNSFYLAAANRYFLSEESIVRASNRFITWPSQQPSGPITIGDTKDHSGYIGLADAAKTIGVDHRTMWLWATRGTPPTDTPLQVVKCPASDQYYIYQKDVFRLKELVPPSGLRRGRRPHLAPHL